MIYTRPFITKRFIAYAGDSYRTELSLAVGVVDAFTEQQPAVALSVRLKELPEVPSVRTDRGFFCFQGREIVTLAGIPITRIIIPDGNYTLVVEPDLTSGNWFYLEPRPPAPWTNTFERPVVLPVPNPLRPLEEVRLAPTPAYPFPANATLVRGTVTQGAAGSVPDAVVSCTYEQTDPADTTQTIFEDVETLSNREGEYVLFFKSLPLNTQQITLTASKGGNQVQKQVVITEGKTLTSQILDLP